MEFYFVQNRKLSPLVAMLDIVFHLDGLGGNCRHDSILLGCKKNKSIEIRSVKVSTRDLKARNVDTTSYIYPIALETICNWVNVHGAQVAYTRYFCPTFATLARRRTHYTLHGGKGKSRKSASCLPVREHVEVQSTEFRDRFICLLQVSFYH